MPRVSSKPHTRSTGTAIRVIIPNSLEPELRRVADEGSLTLALALVALAERGVQADLDARAKLDTAYAKFVAEPDQSRKDAAGMELIRSIFGADAIAENPVQ